MKGLIVGDIITDPNCKVSGRHELWRVEQVLCGEIVLSKVGDTPECTTRMRIDEEALECYGVATFSHSGKMVVLSWNSFRDLRVPRAPAPRPVLGAESVFYPKPEGIPAKRPLHTSIQDDVALIREKVEMISEVLGGDRK